MQIVQIESKYVFPLASHDGFKLLFFLFPDDD